MNKTKQESTHWRPLIFWVLLLLGAVIFASPASADNGKAPSEIFLEEERIDVEADLPSVTFVMNFKGVKYKNLEDAETFIPELLKTVERDPF